VDPLARGESLPDQVTEDTFAELAAFAERATGASAVVTLGRMPNNFPFIEITPLLDGATPVRLMADQGLILALGSGLGGRWELDYTDEAVTFAQTVVEAVIQGRVEERIALGRSEVAVTFEDGSVTRSTGGNLAAFLPLPGWRRRAEVRRSRPYS
jgi:hypothetical protein